MPLLAGSLYGAASHPSTLLADEACLRGCEPPLNPPALTDQHRVARSITGGGLMDAIADTAVPPRELRLLLNG